MDLHDLVDVRIDARGGYKFIVARVTDGVIDKLVIRAKESCGYHDDILDLLKMEASNSSLKILCIGGGMIDVNPDNRIIHIYGKSSAFGAEPDRDNTTKMLKIAFPDFQIVTN